MPLFAHKKNDNTDAGQPKINDIPQDGGFGAKQLAKYDRAHARPSSSSSPSSNPNSKANPNSFDSNYTDSYGNRKVSAPTRLRGSPGSNANANMNLKSQNWNDASRGAGYGSAAVDNDYSSAGGNTNANARTMTNPNNQNWNDSMDAAAGYGSAVADNEYRAGSRLRNGVTRPGRADVNKSLPPVGGGSAARSTEDQFGAGAGDSNTGGDRGDIDSNGGAATGAGVQQRRRQNQNTDARLNPQSSAFKRDYANINPNPTSRKSNSRTNQDTPMNSQALARESTAMQKQSTGISRAEEFEKRALKARERAVSRARSLHGQPGGLSNRGAGGRSGQA